VCQGGKERKNEKILVGGRCLKGKGGEFNEKNQGSNTEKKGTKVRGEKKNSEKIEKL